jgi:hypothetical protein
MQLQIIPEFNTVLNTEIYEYTVKVNLVFISLFPGFYQNKTCICSNIQDEIIPNIKFDFAYPGLIELMFTHNSSSEKQKNIDEAIVCV